MANPNYSLLLSQIAAATDPVVIASLNAQMVINEPLSESEIGLFDYVESGYIEQNPGYDGPTYKSYVGVYVDQDGTYTGDYI